MPKLEYYSGSEWVPVGTISSITAGNGLSGGTITSTGTISLANTTVTAGTYVIPTVTVNAQGQITSATSIGSGAANQILQTNGTSLFWGKYLSSPSIGSFCLTESNKTFSGVQNTAFGDSALNANTTGYYNTSVGNYALNKVTSGYRNTAVGAFALLNNVIGNNNCAFGESSLLWNTGSNNSAFGNNTLSLNTSGYYNVAFGNESLGRNTTGYRNVAVGYSSLLLCSTGDSNTAVGDLASYNTTTGYSNTSVGASSLYTMSTGYDNCSFGALSLYFTTSGYQNCSFGRSALYANTTGYQNSAFGFVSLSSNTTGNNNTAVGQNALSTNTTGSNNTAVGYAANVSASGLSNATSIGAYSVCGTSNAIVLGGSSSINNVYYPNIGIGQNSPSYSLHIGNTQQTPVASIGIENTTNTPSALTGGAVIYASGGNLYAVTLNSGTQKIGSIDNLGTVTSVAVSGSTGLTVSGSPITSSGTITLTLNAQLQGLSSLAANGLIARTASGAYAARTLTAGTGISVTNGTGVSGNPTVAVSNVPISSLASYPTNSNVFLCGDGTWSKPYINNLLINGNLVLSNQTDTQSWKSGTPQISFYRYADKPEASFGFEVDIGFLKILSGKSGSTRGVDFIACDTGVTPSVFRNVLRIRNDGAIVVNPANDFASGVKITNLANPTSNQDAATKSYADSLITTQLQNLSSLSTTGFMVRTGANTFATRSLSAGSGISITNSDGTLGNTTISAIAPFINALSINGDVNLSTYNLTTSGTINATTGTLKANNLSTHNSNTISVLSPLVFNNLSSDPIQINSNSNISSISLNNSLSTSVANEICFKESGTYKIGFGYNNSTNEGYIWGADSSAFKIGTNNILRLKINTFGGIEIPGSSSAGSSLEITRPYSSASQDPGAIYLKGSSTSGTFYDALIDPSKFSHFFGQIVFTRGQKASFVIDSNAYGEGTSIAMNGDYIQFINPLDDLGIIFTDEDSGSSSSYVSYISSSGSYVTSSSSHKKYSIRKKDHKNYLERINKLNVYSYAYKCNINCKDNSKIKDRKYFKAKRLNVGFLADEVDQLFDNCTDKYKLIDINEDNLNDFDGMIKSHTPSIDEKDFVEEKNKNRDGPGIKYDSLLCYTVLALQELSKKVDQYINKGK